MRRFLSRRPDPERRFVELIERANATTDSSLDQAAANEQVPMWVQFLTMQVWWLISDRGLAATFDIGGVATGMAAFDEQVLRDWAADKDMQGYRTAQVSAPDCCQRCGLHEDRTIAAYADAERRGEVERQSITYPMGSEDYARRLLADGLTKGWLHGDPSRRTHPSASSSSGTTPTSEEARTPRDRLIAGTTYRRKSLHAVGLGGSPRPGISYPARGGAVLLFSGTGRSEFGYRDGWDGSEYRYYGEWPRGRDGDMVITAGNKAILERSSELLLFTKVAPTLYRFEGRFECVSHTQEPVTASGHTKLAIVFRLKREADVVELES